MNILPAGSATPDFTLHSTPDRTVSLSEFRGRNVTLAFCPADWIPACGDQLALYNELLEEFGRYEAQRLALSADGAWNHAALSRDRKYHFPLLSDFEPKGAVARKYGVHDEKGGSPGAHGGEALEAGLHQVGLDEDRVTQMLRRPGIDARIQADFMGGVRSGVNGTPGFFLDGYRVDGGVEDLEYAITQRIEGH